VRTRPPIRLRWREPIGTRSVCCNAAPKRWALGAAAGRLPGPEGRAGGGLPAAAPSVAPPSSGGPPVPCLPLPYCAVLPPRRGCAPLTGVPPITGGHLGGAFLNSPGGRKAAGGASPPAAESAGGPPLCPGGRKAAGGLRPRRRSGWRAPHAPAAEEPPGAGAVFRCLCCRNPGCPCLRAGPPARQVCGPGGPPVVGVRCAVYSPVWPSQIPPIFSRFLPRRGRKARSPLGLRPGLRRAPMGAGNPTPVPGAAPCWGRPRGAFSARFTFRKL
jgi:hypothetical protein